MFTDFELAPNLKLKYTNSHYGPCIQLERRGITFKRSITLSFYSWKKLRRQVPRMRTVGVKIQLTEDKAVVVDHFSERNYVCFTKTYILDQNTQTCRINLSPEEWQNLVDALPFFDEKIPTDSIVSCNACQKKTVIVHDWKMQPTLLSEVSLAMTKANNEIAYNQQMYECEYCGGYPMAMETVECHCHGFNCRRCEPDNFCTTCGDLTVEPINSSSI